MSTQNNEITILKKAKQLILDPQHWTQETAYEEDRDAFGFITCKRYCLIGAVGAATHDLPVKHSEGLKLLNETFNYLATSLNTTFQTQDSESVVKLIDFNDHKDTTHTNIIKLIEDTIKKGAPHEKED